MGVPYTTLNFVGQSHWNKPHSSHPLSPSLVSVPCLRPLSPTLLPRPLSPTLLPCLRLFFSVPCLPRPSDNLDREKYVPSLTSFSSPFSPPFSSPCSWKRSITTLHHHSPTRLWEYCQLVTIPVILPRPDLLRRTPPTPPTALLPPSPLPNTHNAALVRSPNARGFLETPSVGGAHEESTR